MRLNLDSKALTDPRFAKLGQRCKPPMHKREALGRCADVWMFAMENRSEILAADDIDALADFAGFADAMIAAGLAAAADAGLVRLAGVKDRIGFLLLQDKKLKGANEAKLAAASARGSAPASAPASAAGTTRGHVPIPLDQSLDPSPAQPPTHDRRTEQGGGSNGIETGVSAPAESARLSAASAGPETRKAIEEMGLSAKQLDRSLSSFEASIPLKKLHDAGATVEEIDARRAEWVRKCPMPSSKSNPSKGKRKRANTDHESASPNGSADANAWRSPL